MNTKELLKSIGERTNGDVYLGVVGPVRSGKSTFIKKFMELAVIPNMSDEYEKARTNDELPQSGEGKIIMTTEPKFVPNNAAKVVVDSNLEVRVRLVDCVGYVMEGAKGYKDEDGDRMVKTPWFDEPIPFKEAAKIGTQKVIVEHSTIGVVVTSDGSIVDIDRNSYEVAEEEVINELLAIGKPFVIVLNSKDPTSEKAVEITNVLKEKYNVPVLCLKVDELTLEQASEVLHHSLYEFPVANINIGLPNWIDAMEDNHWLKKSISDSLEEAMESAKKIKDVDKIKTVLINNEHIENIELTNIDTSNGLIDVEIEVKEGLYEEVMKEVVGQEVLDKGDLLALLIELSNAKKNYDNIKDALEMARVTGYGVSTPSQNDIEISKPCVSKQGNRYGLSVKAKASSYHIVRVDVDTSFEPLIGSKEQSEALVAMLNEDYQASSDKLLDSSIFGRKLGDVIQDGLKVKTNTLPEHTRGKVQQIVKTLANKGKTNVIAIVF